MLAIGATDPSLPHNSNIRTLPVVQGDLEMALECRVVSIFGDGAGGIFSLLDL